MSDQLKPALSPEEWAAQELGKGIERHKLAALCLYGQPFGFTREDTETLRHLLASCDFDDCGPPGASYRSTRRQAECSRLEFIAARIEALLPPAGGATDEPLPPIIWWKGEAYTLEEYATMVETIPLEDRLEAYRKLVAFWKKR